MYAAEAAAGPRTAEAAAIPVAVMAEARGKQHTDSKKQGQAECCSTGLGD